MAFAGHLSQTVLRADRGQHFGSLFSNDLFIEARFYQDISQYKPVVYTRACFCADPLDQVRAFGAVGDGRTLDTAAVRAAAAAARGGTLLFPPGDYLTGAVNLSSHTDAHLAAGATVRGSADGEDWPLVDPASRTSGELKTGGSRELYFYENRNLFARS